MQNYLVFDIGGTFIKYALMDESTFILEKNKVPTPDYINHDKEDFYQLIDKIVKQYKNMISGIAIGMPGMLNSVTGYCYSAGYLAYLTGCSITEELSKRYKLPVSVENDGKCAALAEYWKGNLNGCTNGAVVVLGSGVGGGLILEGKLYRGNHFSAGEYSYICKRNDGIDQKENYWGVTGGVRGLARYVAKHTCENWEDLTGIEIFRRINAGEEKVISGLKEYTDSLAVGIYNLNILLDLDVIAIGGGISRQPVLLEYVKKSIEELLESNPLKKVSPYIPQPMIMPCKFYNDSNLIGALYHFLKLRGEL